MTVLAEDLLLRLESLGYGTDTEEAQLHALATAQKRIINARRWTFQLFGKTITLVAGSASNAELLSELAGGAKIDAIRIESGTSYYELEHKDYEELQTLQHLHRERGIPEFWSQVGNNVEFWPTPDKAYTGQCDLVSQAANKLSKGTAIIVPEAYTDILVWAAAISIAYRERDWDAHNFARQMYAELYAEMLAQYGMTDRQTAKTVAKSGFYDRYDILGPWLP